MRYFDGDASADGGAGTANYLMILVGAHHADRAPYDRGDQAVIIAGCNTTAVPNTFNTLPWIKPATEHPPMKSVERLPRLASFDNIDYIEVTFQ